MKDSPVASNRSLQWLAFLGCVLIWSSFPPLGLYALAPIGVALWLPIIVHPESPKRIGYFWLWVAGSLLWLALLQGIRLAYWPLYFGWFALSLYLGIYLPLFIGLTRTAIHRWRFPLLVMAPILWVGLEWVRSYALTGFAGCMLGHALAPEPIFLQIADQLGAYGVSAAILITSVGLYGLAARFLQRRSSATKALTLSASPKTAALAFGLVALWIGYGWYRVSTSPTKHESPPLLRIALIQENAPTMFETNEDRNRQAWYAYLIATESAVRDFGPVDLIVWPESVFTRNEPIPYLDTEDVPPELVAEKVDRQMLENAIAIWKSDFRGKMMELLRSIQTPPNKSDRDIRPTYFLLGSDVVRYGKNAIERYNAALWVADDGQLVDYYAKQHLVMFGEYIPLGDWIPFFYSSLRMAPVRPGDETKVYDLRGVRIAPSICFENMVPQAVQKNVRKLTNRGSSPDVLVNITNDGWFRGSSMLDHHLACATLAAVENRRPMLVAANTGISAWIDGDGRRIRQGKRMQKDILIAEPTADHRWGLWQSIGDWPACICGTFSIALLLVQLMLTMKQKGHQ